MNTVARRISSFTVAYILFFLLYAIVQENYEFVFYSVVIIVLLLVVLYAYRRIELSDWIMVSLSAFGLLHLAGGNLTWYGTKLYDIGYFNDKLHFDNIVHAIGIFLATIILYNLIHPFIDQRVKDKYIIFYGLLILMALGVGSINEIIELSAVEFLGAAHTVGDYLNNAFDIVFNFIGALLAVIVIHRYIRHEVKLRIKELP